MSMYKIDKTYYDIPNLPVNKIVHLSDIHNNPKWNFLYAEIKNENPDIIVITGDITGKNYAYENSLEFINILCGYYKVLFISGNHERSWHSKNLLKILKDIGVIILNDKTMKIDDIRFTGLNKNKEKKYIANNKDFNILLVHEPEKIDNYIGYDLILCGHAHGGQWRFFNRGIYSTSQGLFPKLTAGINKNNAIISRGCGDVTKIPRINNNHEIIIIRKGC